MERQKRISEARNQTYLDTIQDVLLETAPEPGLFIGRTMYQAPEVDGLTYVRTEPQQGKNPAPGDFVRARIVDTLEYDLVGKTP
jgi:ribosomal protein S12 methylthiotransferase